MKINQQFILAILLISTIACGLTGVPANRPVDSLPVSATAPMDGSIPTFMPVPSFTPIPTLTPAVPTAPPATPILSQLLSMQSIPFSESGVAPVYTVTARIPNLQGSVDPRVANFNAYLDQIVHEEIGHFKTDVLASALNPPITGGSSFDLQFAVIGQRADIWSIKFDISYYSDGAAHPGHYSRTLNYDLQNGRELTLNELFIAGTNYLLVISDECRVQLAARDIAFEMSAAGADPLAENYQRWNLSNDGLIITFDEYQVAAYAAGPQIVTVPFSSLQTVLNLQSAIRLFAQ